ncbi:hypothetical protein N9852_02965 [Alphaproteobacteria bacterium]|nr:hypothetical protein [Alphaproteobacteria bacterium]
MKKYEYKICKLSHINLKKELKDLGSQGWEMVFYSKEEESIFKREVEVLVSKNLEVLNEQFSDEINLENLKKDQ